MPHAILSQADTIRPADHLDDWFRAVLCAILLHAAVWTFGPSLYVHSMHADTMEIIYWGREWQLSYPKHPPLAAWVLRLFFTPGPWSVTSLLLFGQACVAVSAAYIWRTARLIAGPQTAALAVLFFLASPAATVLGVQVNHNSTVAPFWAASLFYGLAYMMNARGRDAVAFGVVAGLGIITKYEIAILLAPLVIGAAIQATARGFLRAPSVRIGAFLFVLITAPHLWHIAGQDAATVTYALSARRMVDATDLLSSARDALIGHLTVLVGPALALIALGGRIGNLLQIERSRLTLAACLALTPSVVLILASLATLQDIRQGWILPMTPNIVVGVALLCDRMGFRRVLSPHRIALFATILALMNALAFFAFLSARSLYGKPVEAFDLGARSVARRIEALWISKQTAPLQCLVIDARNDAASLLWLESRPQVVSLSDPAWSTPDQIARCKANGAIAVLHETSEAIAAKRLCIVDEVEWKVRSGLMPENTYPQADLFYIPPTKDDCIGQRDLDASQR